MRVLSVVEDDVGMRVLIQELLRDDERLDLAPPAATLDEALERARETQPALVILDHYIEGDVMGLEAAPMLKKVAPDCKILLFTSHDLTVEASREPAIDAILLKRNFDKLLPTVQSLLALD